ncbi:MAG: hypothetical protein ARM1_0019 [Candidatus Micrarchaeota archaeon]|nr:MAG: hypothetical protein ARM1_0019 [Candidatus Micrarchaeota archaeon]
MPVRDIDLRELLKVFTAFLIVQFLGFLMMLLVYNNASYSVLSSVSYGQSNILYSISIFVSELIIAVIILLLLIRFLHGAWLYYFMEGAILLLTLTVFFGVIISSFLGEAYLFAAGYLLPYVYIIALAISIGFIIAKHKINSIILRNFIVIMTSVGLGLLIGIYFGFFFSLIFLVIMAVYDYVSVFITKHMVALAEGSFRYNLAMMLYFSETKALDKSSVDKRTLNEIDKDLKKNKEFYKSFKSISNKLNLSSSYVPLVSAVGLGNGDLALPLSVVVASVKYSNNFILPLTLIAGGALGLALTFYLLYRYRRPLPAIPPLSIGILFAFSLYILLNIK